ncbi:MAG: hypothetical protein JXR76_20335 [Deltaproteobacteria bacterium]|nr:hypothetical protein [Deltaproteobacteria bacterium]
MATSQWSESIFGILRENSQLDVDTAHLALNISNGTHQKIFSLGTYGFVVCNFIDRELLLVDPWPTHYSRWIDAPKCHPRFLEKEDSPPADASKEVRASYAKSKRAKSRIAELASFLRRAVESGFTLSGILLSHSHFDHADDIGLLIELLITDDDEASDRSKSNRIRRCLDRRDRVFHVRGNPLSMAQLPVIAADIDTIFFVQTAVFGLPLTNFFPGMGAEQSEYFWHNESLRDGAKETRNLKIPKTLPRYKRWHALRRHYHCPVTSSAPLNTAAFLEMCRPNGARVFYNDSYNYLQEKAQQTKAGVKLKNVTLGHFHVAPFVFDHINVGVARHLSNELRHQNNGSLQRTTSFVVHAKTDPHKRTTCFIGSAGEMSKKHTKSFVNFSTKADLLIYAGFRRFPADAQAKTRAGQRLINRVLDFSEQIDEGFEWLVQHVEVCEAVVFAHFEEFMTRLRNTATYRKDVADALPFALIQIKKQIRHLEAAKKPQLAKAWEDLLENNRIYVLARRGTGFEKAIPGTPEAFETEENVWV